MATATLVNAAKADAIPSAGTAHTGPCSIMATGSTVWGSATATIMVSVVDTAALYRTTGGYGALNQGHDVPVLLDIPGTYYVRVDVSGVTSDEPSDITIVSVQ